MGKGGPGITKKWGRIYTVDTWMCAEVNNWLRLPEPVEPDALRGVDCGAVVDHAADLASGEHEHGRSMGMPLI